MDSRCSSYNTVVTNVETVLSAHDRTHSNASAYSLATPLAFADRAASTSSVKDNQAKRSSFLSKLMHGKLSGHGQSASHHRQDSAHWEWRCKGEDMDNFEWPIEDANENQAASSSHTIFNNAARHAVRISSGSTASSSSVQSWSEAPFFSRKIATGTMIDPDAPSSAQSRCSDRLVEEQAAIDALQCFFARQQDPISMPPHKSPLLAAEADDFGIDLSAYDEIPDGRPLTFVEAPPTPDASRKSISSRCSSESSSSVHTKMVSNFHIQVHRHLPIEPQVVARQTVQQLASVPQIKPACVPHLSRPVSARSTVSAPLLLKDDSTSDFRLVPLQRRRPSSTLIVAAAVEEPIARASLNDVTAYTSHEIRRMSEERRGSTYAWV